MRAPLSIPSASKARSLVLACLIAIFGPTLFIPRTTHAYTTERHFPIYFSNVSFKEATLGEIFDWIREKSAVPDPRGLGLNIVVDSRRLPVDILNRRVSYQAETVSAPDLIRDITERANIGYRFEPYATFITTRDNGSTNAPLRPENRASAARYPATPRMAVLIFSRRF